MSLVRIWLVEIRLLFSLLQLAWLQELVHDIVKMCRAVGLL